MGSAGAEGFILVMESQLGPATTYMSAKPSGIAYHETKVRNIACHDRPSSNHGIGSNCHSANDGSIGPDAGALANQGSNWDLEDLTSRHEVVRKYAARSQENAILNTNSVPEGDAVLDDYVVSNHNT
jgi:hypothetical protein